MAGATGEDAPEWPDEAFRYRAAAAPAAESGRPDTPREMEGIIAEFSK